MNNEKVDPALQKDIQDETHDAQREAEARAGYIRWRMGDVPTVYTNLMPYSTNVAELYEAERSIRAQVKEDQKLLASPWRKAGPRCHLLDWSNISSEDGITLEFETRRGLCMPDAVKPGFENHPAVEAAWERARAQPRYILEVERGILVQLLSVNNSQPVTDSEAREARDRIAALEEQIRNLNDGFES